VLFIATAQAGDDEMHARIEKHRAERGTRWRTLEATRNIARALADQPPARVVLLDCVTLWVSNVLLAATSSDHSNTAGGLGVGAESAILAEVGELLAWHRASDTKLIVVSNEVGMGIVPGNELGRAYRDLLGAVNRKIAAEANEVFFMVAGIAMEVKSRGAASLRAPKGRSNPTNADARLLRRKKAPRNDSQRKG
jgi:adenosyl cobinamide kinase/adenosyl cobinamide phosphate guanylyltransferase